MFGIEYRLEATLSGRDRSDDVANEFVASTEVVDERERTHPERARQTAEGQGGERLVDEIVNYLFEQGGLLGRISCSCHVFNITHRSYN